MVLEEHQYLGNYVRLDHGDGIESGYAHLVRSSVALGEVVEKGQRVGYSGATGLAFGAHLHWEVFKGGERVDPSLHASF